MAVELDLDWLRDEELDDKYQEEQELFKEMIEDEDDGNN